jgi:hypothetical protein
MGKTFPSVSADKTEFFFRYSTWRYEEKEKIGGRRRNHGRD